MHLLSVLLDGGLGLSVASNGMLKGQAKISSVSLKLFLHPESLSLALGLCLKGNLHGVQGLGLSLLDQDELLLLLSKAALNLLPDSCKLKLAPQHLVLLLLEGGLSLLQGRLQLQLLSLQALPDLVNLMDGSSTLADLVHDVLDLIGERLVLPADFLQLEHGLLVGRLDLEQLRGGVASLLLADVKVKGQAVDLALRLLNLVQLGVQVVDGSLGLSETSGQLHLGHLQLLTLGNSVSLVLLAPALGLTLGLGNQPQGVFTAS